MTRSSAAPAPSLWLLASPHSGDNTQLNSLAAALGWPHIVKKLAFRPYQTVARLTLGATLIGLDRQQSSELKPPFPDLVIFAGRCNEAAALWIKQSNPGRTRTVAIGTPWASLQNFDLVITTPQYRLPSEPNVLHNDLPMHAPQPKESDWLEAWQERFRRLPRPWIAVLVGGNSGPYTFNRKAADRLAFHASTAAGKSGGSLLVTTSARTPAPVIAELAGAIACPHYFHNWTKTDAANPYPAYIALADRFIVTADSISMLAEACATGKPVAMFDIESGEQSMRATSDCWLGKSLSATAFRLAMKLGPPKWSRDLRLVHRNLIRSNRTYWLDEIAPPETQTIENRDMARSVARIRALLSERV